MAALRERHSARDGVGHADRPRFNNAFSLDAQSRGVCLSVADWRYSDPNANTDINTDRDADSNCHCDSNWNSNANANA